MSTPGYTLVEILIVLFIISMVTSVALLSISHNENKQMESFANEMAQIITFAEEQAMLETNVLGISFAKHGYQFASLQSTSDVKQSNWLPLHDEILGKHHIPGNIQISIEMGNVLLAANEETENIKPQITISTNGDITPFTIYVGKKGEKPRYAIIGNADGNITNKFLS